MALTIGLVEGALSIGLFAADWPVQIALIAVMVAFGAGFWLTVFFRHHALYGPYDYLNEENFVALIKRVSDTDEFARLIDQKIEQSGLFQFARLSEPARRLFLAAYRHTVRNERMHADASPESPNVVKDEVLRRFSIPDVEDGLRELFDVGWLAPASGGFDRTSRGEEAHSLVGQFAYGRLL